MANYKRKIKCFFISKAESAAEKEVLFGRPIDREKKMAKQSLISSVMYFLGGDYWHAKRALEIWLYLRKG